MISKSFFMQFAVFFRFIRLTFIFIIITFGSCNYKKPVHFTFENIRLHPSWQNNYYKYRYQHNPYVSKYKIYQLDEMSSDTTINNIDIFSDIEIISLNNNSVKHVPDYIKYMRKLKALNFTKNAFSKFPRIVFAMPNLICFYYWRWDNSIRVDTIAYNFDKLPNLEILSLGDCGLKDIPVSVTKLKKLKSLSLERNEIRKINTPLNQMDSLIELDLSVNQLKKVPSGIFGLHFLEEIDLSNNEISSLPLEILNLKNLRKIDLRSNLEFKLTLEMAFKINENLKKLEIILITDINYTDEEKAGLNEILSGKLVFKY